VERERKKYIVRREREREREREQGGRVGERKGGRYNGT
jgi:hypothetical protein